MNIDDWLDMIVCPKTGDKLQWDEARNLLISHSAQLAYPVKNNIPILLESEAITLDSLSNHKNKNTQT